MKALYKSPMDSAVIVVHAGAWAIPDTLLEAIRPGIKAAARKGYDVLRAGGSALDAVQTAVMTMEDNPAFNAGRGSTPNCNGEVEMDALIMDGRHLAVGSVACVRSIANPIALARLVMDKTDHTLLVDRGANEFGREMDVPLVTAEAETELQQFIKKAYDNSVSELFTPKIADVHQEIPDEESKERHDHETVGAVALDSHGNVACATSTGGIPTKKPGRVGDSPIVGAGGYADNDVGAVSSTGHGESITRVCLAQRVISHMQSGSSAREAAKKALAFMSHRIQGFGGVIVVGRNGDIAHVFTTPRMAWASIGGADGLLRHGINPDEDICEQIEQL